MNISIAEYEKARKLGESAEMTVKGVLRGGYYWKCRFYFCGAVPSVGLQRVVRNETLVLNGRV